MARELSLVAAHDASSSTSTPSSPSAAFEEAKQLANLGFASPVTGTLVLANTLLGGSGMLCVPRAFAMGGYALGMSALLLFGALSAFGCHLLHCAARQLGNAPCSFYTVATAVAPRLAWLIDGAVMIKCFGVSTSYLIIVGDLAPPALHAFGVGALRRWHVITMGFVVAATLASFRNLNALRYVVVFSVAIVAWTVCLLGLFLAGAGSEFDPCGSKTTSVHTRPCKGAVFEPVDASHPLEFVKALPVLIFVFTCQQNIFTVCNEVRNSTTACLDRIILVAYLAAAVLYGSAAVFGYATYGDRVKSNVLKEYPQSTAVDATRLLYSLLAVFSFPLQLHPSRASALGFVAVAFGPGQPAGGALDRERASDALAATAAAGRRALRADTLRFALVTAVLLACSYAIALAVEDLGQVLGIVGATGSTMVSYILPGLVYCSTFPPGHAKRGFALGQLLLGCVIMPVALVTVLFG